MIRLDVALVPEHMSDRLKMQVVILIWKDNSVALSETQVRVPSNPQAMFARDKAWIHNRLKDMIYCPHLYDTLEGG